MSRNRQTILVLGGGVGGVVTAVELRQGLSREHRIVLVDREERHLFPASLLWLILGLRTAEEISRPLDRLGRRGIEVVRGEIRGIDAAARRVTVDGATLEGDAVVVSLGADLAPESVPGLAGAGHDLCTLRGAGEGGRGGRDRRRSHRGMILVGLGLASGLL